MKETLAPLAHLTSWLSPALLVLLIIMTTGWMRKRVTLPTAAVLVLFAATAAASLFNLVYFVLL